MEEEDFPEDRKEEKRWKKRISRRGETKKKELPTGKHRGRVLSIHGQRIIVDKTACVLRGILKKEFGKEKNLVVVGDIVTFEETAEGEGVILSVEPRYSQLSRAEHLDQKRKQLIAANIDQVLITVSVAYPSLKPGLVDRYIIAATKGNMEPVIVLNKIDLPGDTQAFIKTYEDLGFRVIPVSAETKEGLDALRTQMENKASVFSGQSGVGKSSLINAMLHLELPTGEVTERTQKGAHTTTCAELIPLKEGGWCIDTPGIRSFGVWDLTQADLQGYFSELSLPCRFPNCSHTHEPDCAVPDALASGQVSQIRYDSYKALLKDTQTPHKRR